MVNVGAQDSGYTRPVTNNSIAPLVVGLSLPNNNRHIWIQSSLGRDVTRLVFKGGAEPAATLDICIAMVATSGQEILDAIYMLSSIGASVTLCIVLMSQRKHDELPEDIEANS